MVHETYDYSMDLMKVCVDDFRVIGEKSKHMLHLRLCLQWCKDTKLKLKPTKWAFVMNSWVLLGHLVSKEGLTINVEKVKAIVELPRVVNLKQLDRCVRKIKWHTRFIKYMAHVACPIV